MDTTLVLDVGYRPIACAPWQTAIVWVLEKAVEVVDEYPDRYIRSPSWQCKMPSVVRLLKPVRRKHAIKFSRQNVYARDGGRCQYCGVKVPVSALFRSSFPFSPEKLRGKVWIAHFFFTSCTQGCEKTKLRMMEIQDAIRGKNDLALVSISVNPDVDTPEVLTAYAKDMKACGSVVRPVGGER